MASIQKDSMLKDEAIAKMKKDLIKLKKLNKNLVQKQRELPNSIVKDDALAKMKKELMKLKKLNKNLVQKPQELPIAQTKAKRSPPGCA